MDLGASQRDFFTSNFLLFWCVSKKNTDTNVMKKELIVSLHGDLRNSGGISTNTFLVEDLVQADLQQEVVHGMSKVETRTLWETPVSSAHLSSAARLLGCR